MNDSLRSNMAKNPLGRPLKYINDVERNEARNSRNRERLKNLCQVRFSVAEVVERWKYAKEKEQVKSDADFARFLLD